MGIRLTWVDNNFGEDGHRVYRDTSPMNPLSLPSPLATLGPDVTQYDDASVVDGNTYYYRVSAYIGATEVVSDEVSIEASGWTPAQLFTSGQEGAWYDFSDLTTLFTDTDGTTNVTADGDLVARIEDKSGNGHHLIQSTPTSRATYRTNGTNQWLEFDGGDMYRIDTDTDILRNVNSGLVGFILRSSTISGTDGLFELYSGYSQSRLLVRCNTTNVVAGGRILDADSFATTTVSDFNNGGSFIVHADYTNGDLDVYFDGTLEAENTSWQTPNTTSDTASTDFALGDRASETSYPITMEMYQFVIVGDNSHSSAVIDQLHNFLLGKSI